MRPVVPRDRSALARLACPASPTAKHGDTQHQPSGTTPAPPTHPRSRACALGPVFTVMALHVACDDAQTTVRALDGSCAARWSYIPRPPLFDPAPGTLARNRKDNGEALVQAYSNSPNGCDDRVEGSVYERCAAYGFATVTSHTRCTASSVYRQHPAYSVASLPIAVFNRPQKRRLMASMS